MNIDFKFGQHGQHVGFLCPHLREGMDYHTVAKHGHTVIECARCHDDLLMTLELMERLLANKSGGGVIRVSQSPMSVLNDGGKMRFVTIGEHACICCPHIYGKKETDGRMRRSGPVPKDIAESFMSGRSKDFIDLAKRNGLWLAYCATCQTKVEDVVPTAS